MHKHDIGKMRQRIYIQVATRTSDGMGGHTRTWETVRTRPAYVVDESGEINFSQEMHREATVRVKAYIRYTPYLDDVDNSDLRVLYKGKVYRLESVKRLDWIQNYMELILSGNTWEATGA